MLEIAKVVSQRSTCARAQVGCVLTNLEPDSRSPGGFSPTRSHTRILAMGYNGMEAGGKNECDTEQPGQCGCIHAEVNALIKASPGPKACFVTMSPCLMCSRLMINSGIRELWFGEIYRDTTGLQLLQTHGVKVHEVLGGGKLRGRTQW